MFTELKKVYDYFQDEESRMIFRQRLLYGLTNDLKYIRDMLLSYRDKNKGYNDFLDILAHPENFRGKEIILFGTGLWGRCLLRWLNYCEIECTPETYEALKKLQDSGAEYHFKLCILDNDEPYITNYKNIFQR